MKIPTGPRSWSLCIRIFGICSLAVLTAVLSGCRAHMVDATIMNQGPPVQLVEFDYPSASFGVDKLATGGRYHYSFQIQESGPVTLIFEERSGKSHTSKGPTVHAGQEGSLTVTIGEGYTADWSLELKKR